MFVNVSDTCALLSAVATTTVTHAAATTGSREMRRNSRIHLPALRSRTAPVAGADVKDPLCRPIPAFSDLGMYTKPRTLVTIGSSKTGLFADRITGFRENGPSRHALPVGRPREPPSHL